MSELAIKLINEAYETKAEFLDLGNCGLKEIPKEIVKLRDTLKHLNLGSWYLTNDIYGKSANRLDANNFADNKQSLFLLNELPYLNSLQVVSTGLGETGAKYISALSSLTFLNLYGNDIGDQGGQYISRLTSLTTLDLSYNKIQNGIKYIGKIPSLSRFNFSGNQIDDLSIECLKELVLLTSLTAFDNFIANKGAGYLSYLTKLEFLNLSKNTIGEVGANYISQLHSLKELNLSNNQIKEFGAKYISQLPSLISLNLSKNKIGNQGAKYISRITSLKSLSLSNNSIDNEGVQYISHLSSLTSLNLANNEIGEAGAEYISRLTLLSSLDLGNNVIGGAGAEYISRLSLLSSLDLGNNAIGDEGVECICRLPSLTSLNLGYNNIGYQGAESISRLFSLTSLNLRNNQIGNQGAANISCLPRLSELNLANNNIKKIDFISSPIINTLNISGNLIEELSFELLKKVNLEINVEANQYLGKGGLFLYNNPIKNIPPEVLTKGREAILEYMGGKHRSLNECKLIFVGDGSVGKTSLMKRLVKDEFNSCEITTHGINKIAWKGIENERGEPIKVNCWDFGGQHIQHSLHQFFFTERVVYVLVLNPRNDEKASYWLDQVDKLGRNSHIIIVYNWKVKEDIQADFLRNFRELRKTYKYLPEPIVLSCATGEGMNDFKTVLKQAILANEGLYIKYPEPWFNIKEMLDTRIPIERHYIEYTEYEAWCAEEKYNDPEKRRNLLRILDSVGAIVFFDKPILNELQVLNPEWITTGAYAILTSEITNKKKGHLTWDDLLAIFSSEKEIYSDKNIRIKYEEPEFKFILQLMLDYWLCQENPLVKHEYLIPVAFGEKPEKEYNIPKGRHYRLKFQSSFEMLIIHRFIAKNILNIVDKDYWNSGIYFKHASSETYALVETNQYSQVINCWIKGTNIRGMWEVIRNDFREIFNMYQNFLFDEEVEYVAGERTVFLKYDEMLSALNNRVLIIPYDPKTGLKNIDVLDVLALFESTAQIVNNMELDLVKVEVNPVININPQITNSPIFNNNLNAEPKKEQPAVKQIDIEAEIKQIRKWKYRAIVMFICSLAVTILLILVWVKKWGFETQTWVKLEHYEVIKWTGVALGLYWSGFVVKVVYDRFFDPSKVKAYRESLRK